MKCKHCGGEQFVAHQVCRMEIIVDGEGDFIDGVHSDASLDIYDSEPAYGPFQCCGCGAEYDVLADGEDSIDGPIEGWTWSEEPEAPEEDAVLKVKQVAGITNCRVSIKDNGNGKELFAGTGQDAALSRFGDCHFEAVSVIAGILVLWIPHDAVSR